MQRKAILILLLLCSIGVWAQQKDKTRKKRKFVFGVGATVNGTTTVIPIDHTTKTPPRENNVANKEFRQIGASIPLVRFVDSAGVEYTNTSLSNDANLFIMMFNPACEHCEDMTIDLGKNIELFKNSKIILVAASIMRPYLGYFYNNTKVGNYPKIKVTLDSCDFINKCFTYSALPQINVYDSNRKLIKIFTGIETIDELKPYIQ